MSPATATSALPAVPIAIDGPSGSGKSSVARGVASEFGWDYLDTGAMYRAMTWAVLQAGVDPADPIGVTELLPDTRIESGTDPAAPTIAVNGVDVAGPIRESEVTETVSLVSAVPQVREQLRAWQREAVSVALAAGRGIVVEGRDIGSEVLPDAPVKVYLTADAAVRAARRHAQDDRSGRSVADVADVEQSLRSRDALDAGRDHSPLRRADGSIEVDATDLDLRQTIDAVIELVVAASAEANDES